MIAFPTPLGNAEMLPSCCTVLTGSVYETSVWKQHHRTITPVIPLYIPVPKSLNPNAMPSPTKVGFFRPCISRSLTYCWSIDKAARPVCGHLNGDRTFPKTARYFTGGVEYTIH